MSINPPFLYCMWFDRKSRLRLTRTGEFSSFSQAWTLLWPVLVPCGLVDPVGPWTCRASFVDPSLTIVEPWLICGFLWTIGEFWWPVVGSLLDGIGFLGHFVIGLAVGVVCVIAVL